LIGLGRGSDMGALCHVGAGEGLVVVGRVLVEGRGGCVEAGRRVGTKTSLPSSLGRNADLLQPSSTEGPEALSCFGS